MTNRNILSRLLALTAVGALTVTAGLVGCSEEPPPPVVKNTAPPPPPPPPPKPKVTPIADLMLQYKIDPRVNLPEHLAPNNDPDRIAVLEFFDAFARGDAATLGTMVSLLDQVELEALAKTDAWDQTIKGITAIDIETGPNPMGDDCALAIFKVAGSYQPQLWYYDDEFGEYTFDAAPTPPHMMSKLYGTDRIALWHQILADEIALANQPDEVAVVAQVDLDEGGNDSSSSSGSSDPGTSPGLTPSGPGGRRPPPPVRPAPGPGN